MRTIILFLAVLMISCTAKQSSINEAEVTETLEGFFKALDVENEDPKLIDQYVTDDFMIYEMGKKMSREEFKELINAPSKATKSEWQLSDYRISTDWQSAHASLRNNGRFVVDMDSLKVQYNYEWLESAYLIKVGEKLKVKFYFSDNIALTTDTIK